MRITYRFIVCPFCIHQMCWTGARLPNYCPECGRLIIAELRKTKIIPEARDAYLLNDVVAKKKAVSPSTRDEGESHGVRKQRKAQCGRARGSGT